MILSSTDVFVEDMEIFDHLIGELILVDECEHPVVATHFQKIKMLVADMKLLMVTGETVDPMNNFIVANDVWDLRLFKSSPLVQWL